MMNTFRVPDSPERSNSQCLCSESFGKQLGIIRLLYSSLAHFRLIIIVSSAKMQMRSIELNWKLTKSQVFRWFQVFLINNLITWVSNIIHHVENCIWTWQVISLSLALITHFVLKPRPQSIWKIRWSGHKTLFPLAPGTIFQMFLIRG